MSKAQELLRQLEEDVKKKGELQWFTDFIDSSGRSPVDPDEEDAQVCWVAEDSIKDFYVVVYKRNNKWICHINDKSEFFHSKEAATEYAQEKYDSL